MNKEYAKYVLMESLEQLDASPSPIDAEGIRRLAHRYLEEKYVSLPEYLATLDVIDNILYREE